MKKEEKVIFTDKTHEYRYKGEIYISVSQLFGEVVKPKKDWDYIASRSAMKKVLGEKAYKDLLKKNNMRFDDPDLIRVLLPHTESEEYLATKKKLRQEWKDKAKTATDRGTAFHLLKENEDIDNGYSISRFNGKKYPTQVYKKTNDNESLVENLYDLPDGYYPELLIFNHGNKLAGQADNVYIETIDGVRYVDIDDWKTDAEILKRPSFRHPQNGYDMLDHPCGHMYDTNYSTYTIKISMYAWMMEQFGFTVRSTAFTSVEVNDDLEILQQNWYTVGYKKWEVEKILKIYHKNLSK